MKVYTYLRKDTARDDGTFNITIIIYAKSKRAFRKSDFWIHPRYWNEEGREVRKSHPDGDRINAVLNAYMDRMRTLMYELEAENLLSHPRDVFRVMDRQGSTQKVIEYARGLSSDMKYHTKKRMGSLINMLIDFNGPDQLFSEWDEMKVRKLIQYMNERLAATTMRRRFRRVRSIFRSAMNEGLLRREMNPFLKEYQLPKKNNSSRDLKLSKEDWKRFMDVETVIPSEEEAKDIFIMQVYLFGARISDVLNLKWSDLNATRLQYRSIKTNDDFSFDLKGRELQILDKYRNEKAVFVFPPLNRKLQSYPGKEFSYDDFRKAINSANVIINKNLKVLAERANLTPPLNARLSTHVARHTFAYLAADAMPLHYLQEALGHESLDQTREYIGRLKGTHLDDYRNDFLDGL